MKKMLNEFKDFAMRGNVLDMAVGIIIGAAFGTIVKSLVDDIIMPPIGMLLGNMDFSNLFFVIKPGINGATDFATPEEVARFNAVAINYGRFINNIVTFLIVAFSVFILVKGVSSLKKEEVKASAEPTDKDCPYCLSKIPIKATRCPHCTSELK